MEATLTKKKRESVSGVEPSLEEWKRIVEAIESSIPAYEVVSEKISLNQAIKARRLAVEYLAADKAGWTLDVGVGPGTSSRLLLSRDFESVIGLDPSMKLLRHAQMLFGGEGFSPVLGVAEQLPLRPGSVSGLLVCFSLRDVRNLGSSMSEFSRVAKPGGRLGIVDVGKPETVVQRAMVGFYIRFGMPIISSLLARGKVPGNPFRMIIPTFDRLVSNRVLVQLVDRVFGSSSIYPIMFGGLVVLLAERPAGT